MAAQIQTTQGPITIKELVDLINGYDDGALVSGTISVTAIELDGTDATITRTGPGAIAVEGVQVILSGAALGTPASGTLTNCTGLPTILAANEATDATCFLSFFTAATGELGPKTNANLAFNASTGVLTLTAPVLGTPGSGTLTNCTGLPAAGVTGTAVVQARTLTAAGLVTGGGTLAADRTFTVTAAVASDQETGTSTTVAVVPGVQHRHPSAAKFWVKADQAGNMNANYNMTSVSDSGTGTVGGTIATDFSSGDWCASTACGNSAAAEIQLTAYAAGTFTSVAVKLDAPIAVADVSNHFIAGFGDQ